MCLFFAKGQLGSMFSMHSFKICRSLCGGSWEVWAVAHQNNFFKFTWSHGFSRGKILFLCLTKQCKGYATWSTTFSWLISDIKVKGVQSRDMSKRNRLVVFKRVNGQLGSMFSMNSFKFVGARVELLGRFEQSPTKTISSNLLDHMVLAEAKYYFYAWTSNPKDMQHGQLLLVDWSPTEKPREFSPLLQSRRWDIATSSIAKEPWIDFPSPLANLTCV